MIEKGKYKNYIVYSRTGTRLSQQTAGRDHIAPFLFTRSREKRNLTKNKKTDTRR